MVRTPSLSLPLRPCTLVLAVSLACLGLAACHDDGAPPPVAAADPDRDLTKALMPDYPDVVGEYVQVDGGVPSTDANVVQTPAVLNKVTFLRVRSALDGVTPKPAHAVVLAMPGFSSTPGHWMYLAAQLVHKANRKTGGCKDGTAAADCRVEVWVVQRRGAHLADTLGARNAIVTDNPTAAVNYYFGPSILGSDGRTTLDGRGKFPAAAPNTLTGRADATWKPLVQNDLRFIADWGFETYARDMDNLLALVQQQSGSRNVFLAGHSQGGSFTALYAGRKRPDNTRGYENLAGIVMLDGGGYGTPGTPTAAQVTAHQAAIDAFRAGTRAVYTDASGANLASGPGFAAREIAANRYFAKEPMTTESLFPPRQTGLLAAASFPGTTATAANDWLVALRLNHLARSGMYFDTSPTTTATAPLTPLQVNVQDPLIVSLGESLGLLDYTPLAGHENDCSPDSAAGRCVPLASQVDRTKVYGWREAGGNSAIPAATKVGVGKAAEFLKGYAWTTNRTNIAPVTFTFPVSGARTVDAREVVTSNWYPSERYDVEMSFLGAGPTFTFTYKGVAIDIDKSVVAVPLYYAHQGAASTTAPSVFPLVTDYTNIGSTGTLQSALAASRSPVAPTVSSRYYKHTDFVSADDSLGDEAARPVPGDPGTSLVANTLLDWIVARTGSRPAIVPTPAALGVRASR